MRARRPLSLETYGVPRPACCEPPLGVTIARSLRGDGALQTWDLLCSLPLREVSARRWAVSLDPLKSASREVRYDTLRTFVGGRLVGEDDKGVMFIDLDGAKGLS